MKKMTDEELSKINTFAHALGIVIGSLRIDVVTGFLLHNGANMGDIEELKRRASRVATSAFYDTKGGK